MTELELKEILSKNPAIKVAGESNIEKLSDSPRKPKKSRALLPEELEDVIQADFFQWLKFNSARFPELDLFFAIPNGSNKSKTERWLFQTTGLKSGVPDTHLPVVSRSFYGLWIEFKSKTGKVSDEQKKWIARLQAQNHRVEVCTDWKEAANIVIEYLDLNLKKF